MMAIPLRPRNLTLQNGTTIFSVTLIRATTVAIMASRTAGAELYSDVSSTFTVLPAAAERLQILLQGESAVPGSSHR